MIIKEFEYDNFFVKDQFSKNIGRYMKKALETGNSIYFYDIGPKQENRVDKLSWITKIKHDKYDSVVLIWIDGDKTYCNSIGLNDKVIKLDLTDTNVKKMFDDKFKIGTTWATWANSHKLTNEEHIFVKKTGYECYNFIVAKDDEIVMDAILYGGENATIAISKSVVHEVDKEYEEEKEKRRKKWRKLLFPFSQQ